MGDGADWSASVNNASKALLNGARGPMVERTTRCRYIPGATIQSQSPQLNLRRYFADLIAIVSNRFRLSPAARHLAVYLLDLFMDRYDVTVQQLHMEREDRVPKLETLNSLGCMSSMNLVLTKQGLLHMELLLLETFQWNLYLPTAAHFIEYYLSIAIMCFCVLHPRWCLLHAWPPPASSSTCPLHGRPDCSDSQATHGRTWSHVPKNSSCAAHDGDVKEANKQKCQQPGQQQQQGQTVYHGSGQTATVAQYLHWPCVQYPQQAPQPGLAPNHRPASYLNHSTASLQTPNGNTQPITALQDPKSSITNRAYQVSMHYNCAAPCFDR
ncbi:hypothetical protein FQN60_015245 [Etheostoma spectabile]|uniref:Cyclin N-terminal domain-containing protein n=1 Tax=Etheostoma spectabile TaxID=54343 RepID=A0A5J5CQN4_9PERO|nr:hypothetical protein FQN60_015245 [Etheostoma spectabile]